MSAPDSRIRRRGLAWLACLLLAPAAAQAQPAEPVYLGQARPEGVPARVISLAPNLTEAIFALGAGGSLVGVTRYDDHPPEVAALPRVGGFTDPSLEAILALRPELVVCVPNAGNRKAMEALGRVKVPVLVLPAETLEDVFLSLETLGKVLGREAAARELQGSLRRRVEAVRARTRGAPKPSVLVVYGHKPLVAAGEGTFAQALIELAGGRNVLAGSRVRYPTVPMEEVLRLAPEVILDASMSGTGSELEPGQAREAWARWSVLPAVRAGRVHLVDSVLWFRPGPRIVQGLEQMARLLHPELDWGD
ncbi:MAG TPA: helical backbone metal receptor [Myxococcota bacterium]|nr:helical backbone metal receptor [Myxococcota bacterium]HRY92935.1 helical backbone metal receptor [Myxococcota bacterium]HSA19846.1 helical backbone metal receptor [Myxococcota bacterium]